MDDCDLKNEIRIRPRYGEVDQMGYVYHANYVSYYHQARTEFLRKIGLHDKFLEDHDIILPVKDVNITYMKPAFYDEELTIITSIQDFSSVKITFGFELVNEQNECINQASSTVVFANRHTGKAMRVPGWITERLEKLSVNTMSEQDY